MPFVSVWTPGTSGSIARARFYIETWTDSSISLVLALGTQVQNGYMAANSLLDSTYLSPISDVSWLMFATAATAGGSCPIGSTDYLYFPVTNPQSGTASYTTSQGWVKVVDRMLEVLRKSPVLHVGGGKTVAFKNIRQPAKTLSLSAEAVPANGDEKPVAIVFGPENGAIIKVIDDRGNELLVVKKPDEAQA